MPWELFQRFYQQTNAQIGHSFVDAILLKRSQGI